MAICSCARQLYARGLIAAIDGNVSVRFQGRWILVTPSGMAKGALEPEDLVLVDLGPAVSRGAAVPTHPRVARARRGRRPSSEFGLHLAVYAARPDVRAVVHAHPPTAVGLTIGGTLPPLDICPESVVLLGDIGLAPYATPGTGDLADSIGDALPGSDTILLARHGAVTLGADLSEAHQRMEALEQIASIYVAAHQVGAVSSLPEQEQERLRDLARSAQGTPCK